MHFVPLRKHTRECTVRAVQSIDLPANRLRELREAAGLKHYDIAARFRVDPSTVYRWERGASPIPDEIKLALATMFEVPASHLMGWEEWERQVA